MRAHQAVPPVVVVRESPAATAATPPYVNYTDVARAFGPEFAASISEYPIATRERFIARRCAAIAARRQRREIVCNRDGLIVDVRTR